MSKIDSIWVRATFSLLLIVGLLNVPAPAFSQDEVEIQDLIFNGGFEEGFQGEFGVGVGWGGFNNGNAVVGWNADSWPAVVVAGQNAQLIEIRNATERNRYAGIYQTVPVVPGQQYKLTLNGLIRSDEGDITLSDYGYRLQYAVDYDGGTAWELLGDGAWTELNWDEQPLSDPPGGVYRFDTYETTLTARGNQMTLFIRGWKKWLDNGSGIFDLDEISLVGPAPAGFQAAPPAQAASVGNSASTTETELIENEPALQVSEHDADAVAPSETEETSPQTEPSSQSASEPSSEPTTEPEAAPQPETAPAQPGSSTQTEPESPPENSSQLPVSGQGSDGSINFVLMSGLALLVVLFVGAMSTIRQRDPLE